MRILTTMTIVLAALAVGACKKTAGVPDGGPGAVAVTDAAALPLPVVEPPTPPSPQDLLDDHRKEMTAAAEAGNYADVCKGAPWVNGAICNWAAARASGQVVGRPDGELFRAYFGKEHWKHVYGQIVGDADTNGDYEVSVGGYRQHCILDTDETKFSSRGGFNMWVQEQPETREVTVNSGATQQWIVLEEVTLAKMLMDLAHSGGGIEGTALAKNAMGLIATYHPYAERKGELPALPSATPPQSSATPSLSAAAMVTAAPAVAAATAPVPVGDLPRLAAAPVAAPAPHAEDPAKRARARAACMQQCVVGCKDDSACERSCAARCPSA